MKSSGQIMRELGFNKNSSAAAKAAFLNHLIKAATGNNIQLPEFEKKVSLNSQSIQLCFDLESATTYQEAI